MSAGARRRDPVEPAAPRGHIGIVSTNPNKYPQSPAPETADRPPTAGDKPPQKTKEIGGPKGPEPTRYGDWEVGGRCIDF
jgi:hypothetical protein